MLDIEEIKRRLAAMTEEQLRAEMRKPTLTSSDMFDGPAGILLRLEYERVFGLALFEAGVPRLRRRLVQQECPNVEAEIVAQRAMVAESCAIVEKHTLAACGITSPDAAGLQ